MKSFVTRALTACLLAGSLALGGCATVQRDWAIVTGTSASPTQIIVAANAFDAVELTVANYLNYCKVPANKVTAPCVLDIRARVASADRAGRAARIQLEPYIVSGTAGPLALYQTLQAVISTLQTSTPTVGK